MPGVEQKDGTVGERRGSAQEVDERNLRGPKTTDTRKVYVGNEGEREGGREEGRDRGVRVFMQLCSGSK